MLVEREAVDHQRVAEQVQELARMAEAVGSPEPQAVVNRLIGIYGSRASDIVALGRDDPALLEPIDPVAGVIGAELVFTYVHEFARTLTDVLIRRTMIGLNADSSSHIAERAADVLATRLGWDRARRDREVEDYRRYTKRYEVPGRISIGETAGAHYDHRPSASAA